MLGLNLTQTQVDISHTCFSKIFKSEKQVKSGGLSGFKLPLFILSFELFHWMQE